MQHLSVASLRAATLIALLGMKTTLDFKYWTMQRHSLSSRMLALLARLRRIKATLVSRRLLTFDSLRMPKLRSLSAPRLIHAHNLLEISKSPS